jgi:nucleoside-diphosphate-sugar epimerase
MWITGDLEHSDALNTLLTDVDVVVHAAGAIKALNRETFFRINRDGTRAVLDAAKTAGVPKCVLVSSLAARAPALSPYAASKRGAELVAEDYADALEVVILRPPAIYGPGDGETVRLFQMAVNGFVLAPASRASRASLIHVGDVATAILACCTQKQPQGILEIDDGTPGGHSWRDLALAAGLAAERSVKIFHLPGIFVWMMGFLGTLKAEITRSPAMLTLSKAPELLHQDWVVTESGPHGWQPKWTLETGFKDAIDWYYSQNVLKRYF